jgi:hypothetical protein
VCVRNINCYISDGERADAGCQVIVVLGARVQSHVQDTVVARQYSQRRWEFFVARSVEP